MRRVASALLTLAFLVAATSDAQAQIFGDFFRGFAKDYRRNASWPEPFIKPDQEAVNTPFALMAQNGWKQQTTLCEYHFVPDTNKLTAAGELKVRWILTQVPESRRVIFVVEGFTPEETKGRVDSVQQVAARIVRTGGLPEVVTTLDEPWGSPAETVDAIAKKREATRPDPQLPPRATEASAGM